MFRELLIALLVLYANITFAQQSNFVFNEITSFKSAALDENYKQYQVFETDLKLLKSHLSTNDFNNVTFQFEGWKDFDLELVSSNLFLNTMTLAEIDNGERTSLLGVELPSCFKGYSKDGALRITINNNYINGFIETSDGDYYFESIPSDNDQDLVILSNSKDVKRTKDYGCAHHVDSSLKSEESAQLQKLTGDCYQVNLAIATDFLLFAEKGSAQNIVNHVIGVMNNTAANYELNGAINFADGIEFNITEILVSSCPSCDPWTDDTNVFQVLNDFKVWANNGGFLSDHKLGQFWTNRNFDGSYVGLADNGSNLLCNSNAYHVLQDYTTSSNYLRVLAAHEIGHCFGAAHVSTTGYIMSASLNNTSTWNIFSKNVVNSELALQGPACLNACGVNPCGLITDLTVLNITATTFDLSWSGAAGDTYDVEVYDAQNGNIIYNGFTPLSYLSLTPNDYEICHEYKVSIVKNCSSGTSDRTTVIFLSPIAQGCADFCPETNVNWTQESMDFLDESTNATSWDWDFGDGASSTEQNPSHVYTTSGSYQVSLSINGGAHVIQLDSLISVLPNRSLPYSTFDGGSFDTSSDDFASDGLNGTTSIWEKGIGTGFLSSTDQVWKTKLHEDVQQIDTESALYSPRFDFSLTGNYVVEFDLGMEAIYCNAPYGLQLQYTTDNGSTWIRLGSYGDTGPNISAWYNRGPTAPCPLSNLIFADQTGWMFNGNNIFTSYDVSSLSGNSEVIFRFLFKVYPGFSSGYAADGALINNFNITASGVVDVDLMAFHGEHFGDYNLITWDVANMVNFDAFVLEKSNDGVVFHPIEEIQGIAEKTSYSHKDYNLFEGDNFYRLRLKDLDGSFELSDVIRLDNLFDSKGVKIFPNPSNGQSVHLETDENIDEIQIVNTLGNLIDKRAFTNVLDISNMPSGTYVINFLSKNKSVSSQKLIVL